MSNKVSPERAERKRFEIWYNDNFDPELISGPDDVEAAWEVWQAAIDGTPVNSIGYVGLSAEGEPTKFRTGNFCSGHPVYLSPIAACRHPENELTRLEEENAALRVCKENLEILRSASAITSANQLARMLDNVPAMYDMGPELIAECVFELMGATDHQYHIADISKMVAGIDADAQQAPAAPDVAGLVEFAVRSWHEQVANRPLVNVHRRTLDSVWRQVIRFAGEDDVALIGPRHDALAAHRKGGAQQ